MRAVRQRAREDTWGRLLAPARPAQTPLPALRRSHFPDPPPTTLRRQSQPILLVAPGTLRRRRTADVVKRSLLDDGEDRGTLSRPGMTLLTQRGAMCGRQTSCPVPDISARCHPIRPIASALPAIEPSPGGCPARKAFPDAESSEALWHADADLLLPGQLGWQTINVSPAIELGPPRSELGSGPTYPSQDKSGQIASSPTRSAQRHNVPSLLLLSRTSAGFLGCRGLRWHVSPGRGGGS
jgi:hypothetical protein